MTAELSVHFQKIDWAVRDVLINSGKNAWVYIVEPPEENHFPSFEVVARYIDGREGEWINLGAPGADLWWHHNRARVVARRYAKWLVTCNEPTGNWTLVDHYITRWIELAHQFGFKTVSHNFPPGCPEPEDAKYFLSSVAATDILAFHEYWVPRHWDSDAMGWRMWRYKKFMDNLPIELQNKPILITECGIDGGTEEKEGGWEKYTSLEKYSEELKRYQSGLDIRVLAAFPFTAGPWRKWREAGFGIPDKLVSSYIISNPEGGNRPVTEEKEPKVRVLYQGSILEIGVENYVKGVLPREVYMHWPKEVLQAQAIAARSYALANLGKHEDEGYDLCATSHCQNYSPTYATPSRRVVEETRGVVGIFRVKPVVPRIAAMFYSAYCGGRTRDDWARAYLRIADCPCVVSGSGSNVGGHGRGMCQWGAFALARGHPGTTTYQILDHYYRLYYVDDYGEGKILYKPEKDAPPDGLEERLAAVEGSLSQLTKYALQIESRLVTAGELLEDLVNTISILEEWAANLEFKRG